MAWNGMRRFGWPGGARIGRDWWVMASAGVARSGMDWRDRIGRSGMSRLS